ncbi:MAG: ABC-2 transporter permease [Clostridium cochlearium]|uniref:ABC-2 transporter permease n=1 Tax=Clostridium cochlearium TaxID=1494 RepID=UPI00280BACC3|nr:ABC-2 transporter permease [Clostridium cochlearium]MDU1442379.1 ABC-2 transporter permease [Clostridium cochlearium]
MKNLILKDLYIIKQWLFVIPILLAIVLVLNNNIESLDLALSITISIRLIYNDDKSKGSFITNSLPVTRKEIIISKYIVLNLFIIFTAFSILLINYITYSKFPNLCTMNLNLKNILSFIFLPNIICAIIIPLYYSINNINILLILLPLLFSLDSISRYLIPKLNFLNPISIVLFLLIMYSSMYSSIRLFENKDLE